jgi:hypothetical protein
MPTRKNHRYTITPRGRTRKNTGMRTKHTGGAKLTKREKKELENMFREFRGEDASITPHQALLKRTNNYYKNELKKRPFYKKIFGFGKQEAKGKAGVRAATNQKASEVKHEENTRLAIERAYEMQEDNPEAYIPQVTFYSTHKRGLEV